MTVSPAPPITLENCNQIIPNLYLGGISAALQTQVLADQGIRAVCCCVRELEFPTCDFHKDLAYYRVDVEDVSREPIELFWPEAADFIHGWVSRGLPVLVHCRAGVSRSASTVIAYLVLHQGYTLRDAFLLARSRRPVVTPNLGFMAKLIDFEISKKATEPTVSLEKYEEWYTGSHMAAVPDVGTGPAAPAPLGAEGSRALLSRARHAVRKAMLMHWLRDTEHAHDVDLDVLAGGTGPRAAQVRASKVRALLLRQAAQDAELGYCEGLHLVATVFLAASRIEAEAYWRFHAFVGGLRGFWLPGFPLLEAGAVQFKEAASGARWFQHLEALNVEPRAYLPQAWLTMFTTWIPLSALVQCLELLEGHLFAGILAMTLAMLDHVSQHLLDQNSTEDAVLALRGIKGHAPGPEALASAARGWLPKVSAVGAHPVTQPTPSVPCRRHGSRVVDESDHPALLELPLVSTLVMDEAASSTEDPTSAEGVDGVCPHELARSRAHAHRSALAWAESEE